VKKKVLEIIRKWTNYLGLGMWEICVEWTDNATMDHYDAMDGRLPDSEFGSVMTVSPNPEYMLAHLVVCVPMLINKTDRQIDEYVCHELIHVVLSDLRLGTGREWSDQELCLHERVTTTLARAFIFTQSSAVTQEQVRAKKEQKKHVCASM
jgi:hypothetical protein